MGARRRAGLAPAAALVVAGARLVAGDRLVTAAGECFAVGAHLRFSGTTPPESFGGVTAAAGRGGGLPSLNSPPGRYPPVRGAIHRRPVLRRG